MALALHYFLFQMYQLYSAAAFAGCRGVTFDFPRDNQVTDYVRYRSYFPALNEGTICFWVNTSDYTRVTGIFSYSVPGSFNEILLGFGNGNDVLFYLRDQLFRFHVAPYLSGGQQVRQYIHCFGTQITINLQEQTSQFTFLQ